MPGVCGEGTISRINVRHAVPLLLVGGPLSPTYTRTLVCKHGLQVEGQGGKQEVAEGEKRGAVTRCATRCLSSSVFRVIHSSTLPRARWGGVFF